MMKNNKWTTELMPDLSGTIAVVTGGYSGLGYESVKELAQKGAKVILAGRSLQSGEQARDKIKKAVGKTDIEFMRLDLADLSSVKAFAANFQKKYKQLHILMNNAGIMMTPYEETRDGFESQFGTNHLGHFALTALLKDVIFSTPGSRIVNVSSNAHKYGSMDFSNLMFENGYQYSPLKAYARSKLANLLFTYELDRRLKAKGIPTLSVAAHPGTSETNLVRYVEGKFVFKLLKPVLDIFTQSAYMGALPQLRAATDSGVLGGEYYGPDGYKQMKGDPVKVTSNEASHSREDAQRLWKKSEELTGVSFPV